MNESIAAPSALIESSREVVLSTARRLVRRFAIVMTGLNLLLPVALFVYCRITGEAFWRMFQGEYGVIEWFSSLQLLLIGWIAYLNHSAVTLTQRLKPSDKPTRGWIWVLVALGFVFFAFDERFDIHEALRDDLFRPIGLFVDVSWLIDGDVGLYLFFVVGLVVTVFMWQELRCHRGASILFVMALVMTLPTIIIDSLRDSALQLWPQWRFWDYAFEEVGEIWAQLLFLWSFVVVLHGKLGRMGQL